MRLSRAEFSGVKRSLETYQLKRYPFLEHSVVFERGDAKKRERRSPVPQRRNESERERRLVKKGAREPSRKELVQDLIAEQLTIADSGKAFFLRLKNLGLLLYKRGKHVTVQDLVGRAGAASGRCYRLKTLGLEEVFQNALEQWKALPGRLMVLEAQELEREQQLWLEHGYRDEIRDVMALRSIELSALERERLEQIRSLRSSQKQQQERDPPEISR